MADLSRVDGDTLAQINAGNKLAMRHIIHLSDLPMLARFARQQVGV
jgi:digeranylgeranylglycerophospholipid reductase